MAGNHEQGTKSHQTIVARYGKDAPTRWGKEGAKTRKTNSGGLCTSKKYKIAEKGGKSSKRARVVKKGERLKFDEIGFITTYLDDITNCYPALSNGTSVAILMTNLIIEIAGKDWVEFFQDEKYIHDNGWREFLGDYLKNITVAKNSNEARIKRNLLKAWEVAGEE